MLLDFKNSLTKTYLESDKNKNSQCFARNDIWIAFKIKFSFQNRPKLDEFLNQFLEQMASDLIPSPIWWGPKMSHNSGKVRGGFECSNAHY